MFVYKQTVMIQPNTETNKPPMQIALALSGGGYRAAAFSLGAISYLQEVVINGRPLLEHVSVLSTVSGGTITGTRYAIGRSRGSL